MGPKLVFGLELVVAMSAFATAASQPARATHLTRANLDSVLGMSDIVAEVEVGTTQARWAVAAQGDEIIYTVAQVRPVQILKNRSGATLNEYRVKGGTVGDVSLQVSGYSLPRRATAYWSASAHREGCPT